MKSSTSTADSSAADMMSGLSASQMKKLTGGDSALSNFMNPNNPVASIRNLTGFGNKELIQGFIDKVNMDVSGGELIQAAIQFGNNNLLKYYIERGAKVDLPPDNVSKTYLDQGKTEYRKSPFIIQAACGGNKEVFQTLQACGCKLTEQGFIGFSKKRKNQVISNAIGAAAFNGSLDILKYLVTKQSQVDINFPAKEQQDFSSKGQFVKEYQGYTPLMLAVASGGQHIESVKFLLAQKNVNPSVKDLLGNTLIHIAVINNNVDALQYLINNVSQLNLFERNEEGETPYSIAQDKKLEKAIKLLDWYQEHFGDSTKNQTEQLLNELEAEEQKEEAKKAKKKEKKHRQKVRQLAEKEGVTFEVMEQKLKEDKEKKKQEEEKLKKQEEEKEHREQQEEEKKQREQRFKQVQHEEEKKKVMAKTVKFKQAENVPVLVKPQEPVTQFAHLKVKKPEPSEKPVAVPQPAKEKKEEEVKAKVPVKEEEQLNRKQRKQILRAKEMEHRKRQPKEVEDYDEEIVKEDTTKEHKEQKLVTVGDQVLVLDDEMKLKSVAGDKARRRLRKKLQKLKEQEEEEEKQVKDKLRKIHEDKLKKEQEEEERLRLEEEEKKKKYEYIKPTEKPLYRVKKKEEESPIKKPASPVRKPASPAKEMKYRPKPKDVQEVAKQEEEHHHHSQQYQTQEVHQQEPAHQHHSHEHHHKQQPLDIEEYERSQEFTSQKKETGVKTPPSSPLPKQQYEHSGQVPLTSGFSLYPMQGSANEMIHQHLQQLQQIILGKDQELNFLHSKVQQLEHDIKSSKTGHSQQQTSSEDNRDLKSQVNHANEQLLREKALNKILNAQVLDSDKALRDEQQKRKIAEEKLFNVLHKQPTSSSAANGEKGLLELANEELRKKDRVNKESKSRLDIYEGHNLDKRSKQELQNAQKQLGEAMKTIGSMLEGKSH